MRIIPISLSNYLPPDSHLFIEKRSLFVKVPLMQESMRIRAIAYLLIINLVGGLLVPSLANAMANETRVLLCTSQGYQWVTVENQQELTLTDDTRSVMHCGYCVSANDDFAESVQPNSFQYISPTQGSVVIDTGPSALKDYFLIVVQSRAPPFFT